MNSSSRELKEVLVGRQPILDRREKIFGYELLFRTRGSTGANVSDNVQATANVMVNTLSNIGIKRLIGEKKGFVNVDAGILTSGLIDLLPKTSTVLEILETVEVTDQLIEICKTLKRAGYVLALDDYIFQEAYEALFDTITYVKIDVLQHDRNALAQLCKDLLKRKVKLLAEKVETKEDFAYCLAQGFELFQGYFFAKPALITAKSISATQLVLLELYKLLTKEDEVFTVENLFKRNPELNVKLLKFMNSASFYTPQKITSIRQVIALLGYRNLQKWVTLLLYAGEGEDMKASPLLERAAIRGRVMELLALRITGNKSVADSAFICGVISLIDVLFRMPMEQILSDLNLSEEINVALTDRTGLLGRLISVMEKLEKEEFDDLRQVMGEWKLSLEDLFLIEGNTILEYENYEEE